MGATLNAALAAVKELAGIEPACGKRAEALEEMSKKAFELIKTIEREQSGIRDGTGGWTYFNVMSYAMTDVVEAIEDYRAIVREEHRQQKGEYSEAEAMAKGKKLGFDRWGCRRRLDLDLF
jgi:hypothetical protein